MAFIYLARSLGLGNEVPVGKDFDLSDNTAFLPDFVSKGTHELRSLCRETTLGDKYHFVERHVNYLIRSE
jgi:hypothetical protein